MPPLTPGKPIAPAPTQTSAQGVQAVAPVAAPTPAQLPTAPTPGTLPAPGGIPNFGANGTGAVSNFYQIPEQARLNSEAFQAQANRAGQQFEAGKYQNQVKIQNLQDQLDPSKYKVLPDPKSQYGVRIINSLGQEVSLQNYVNATGANPAEVLQKSTDPQAKEFVNAYNNFQDLMQTTIAASNGDQTAQAKMGDYVKANPVLDPRNPNHLTVQQVSDIFMQKYGSFFGMPTNPNYQMPSGLNQDFQSANNPVATSPYQNQQLQTLGQSSQLNNPYFSGLSSLNLLAGNTASNNNLTGQ